MFRGQHVQHVVAIVGFRIIATMRKIIFIRSGVSGPLDAKMRDLRIELASHVEILYPNRRELRLGRETRWLTESAKRADYLVVFYSATRECAPIGASASETPIEAEMHADPLHDASYQDVPQVAAEELSQLPGKAEILIAFSHAADLQSMPAGLRDYRRFYLSSKDGHDALLCKLVHKPVTPLHPQRQEAAVAAVRIVTGVSVTIVGADDKTREFLIANTSEQVAIAVHYCMILLVIVLLLTGFVALLRLAIDLIGQTMQSRKESKSLPGRGLVWKSAIYGIGGVAAFVFALRLIQPPDIDKIAAKNLSEWAKQLEDSQQQDGGIRESPAEGVSQVWITSQALTGLLSSPKVSTISATFVQKAYTFVQRTKIAPLDLREGADANLAAQLRAYNNEIDFTKLPTRHFPTFTQMVNVIARMRGEDQLGSESVKMLERDEQKFFTKTPSREGWGYYEQFSWGVTEIAAWVALANIQSLRSEKSDVLPGNAREEIKQRVRDIIVLIRARQILEEGSFSPIENTSNPSFGRTYSTIMALWAMAEAVSPNLAIYDQDQSEALMFQMRRAVAWLRRTAIDAVPNQQAQTAGWKVDPRNPTAEMPFLPLAAQTLFVVGQVPFKLDQQTKTKFDSIKHDLLHSAATWTGKRMEDNDRIHDADRYLYPTEFDIEGSTLLWYPWCVALMRSLCIDSDMNAQDQSLAKKWLNHLLSRASDFGRFAKSEYNYVAAEGLIGLDWPIESSKPPVH